MKTKLLLIASLLGATLLMLSCQKDNEPLLDDAIENSIDVSQANDPEFLLSEEDPQYDMDILSHRPDPFYTRTKIKFMISKTSDVSLSVINAQTGVGETLFHATVNKGVYYKIFDGTQKQTGRYIAVLNVDGRLYKEFMNKKNITDPNPVGEDNY